MAILREHIVASLVEKAFREVLPAGFDIIREFQLGDNRKADLVIARESDVLACIEVRKDLSRLEILESAKKQVLSCQAKLNSHWAIITDGNRYFIHSLTNQDETFVKKESAEEVIQIVRGTQPILNKSFIQKARPAETITEDLQSLEARRKSIQKQLDRGGEDGNSDEVDELQKSLKNIESQILTMRKERDEAQKESQIEKNWDEKIQQAFTTLKECTEAIEQQKDIASQEYQRITNIIYVLCIIVLVWVFSIYKAIFVTQIYFNSWISFLPYYLPIPLFIVVFWVLIVQKNRANKLGITLSNEIYQIRYMEGLLLATNKLSINSETSISRINKAIDVMIESYLHQVEHSGIDENSIEKIEKKELNGNKYMHIIDKLLEKL